MVMVLVTKPDSPQSTDKLLHSGGGTPPHLGKSDGLLVPCHVPRKNHREYETYRVKHAYYGPYAGTDPQRIRSRFELTFHSKIAWGINTRVKAAVAPKNHRQVLANF